MSNQQKAEKLNRRIFYYKDYYLDFFNSLEDDVREKFNWTLQLISTLEIIPVKFFKHITNSSGIYEIRVEYHGNIYRVFCFFDKGNIIILINGFHKKSIKTPKKELEYAEKLKSNYFNEKEK